MRVHINNESTLIKYCHLLRDDVVLEFSGEFSFASPIKVWCFGGGGGVVCGDFGTILAILKSFT